jgi:hypothetical protein
MSLFKKAPIRTVVFFLFLSSISTQLYSQSPVSEPNVTKLQGIHNQLTPIEYADTVILYSPDLPIIFDANHLNVLNRQLTPECPLTKPLFPPLFTFPRLFADKHHKNNIYSQAYDYLIKNNLPQIKYTTADFSGKVEKIEKMPSNIFQYLFKIDYDFDNYNKSKPERFQPKLKYWILTGNHRIQLAQHYISQNWATGGVRNLNLYNVQNVTINYKKNRFQNNNHIEWRLNFFTNPNDSMRRYRLAEDMIRTYSDFGIQAIHNWFYSSNIEIKTQLFNNFVENSSLLLASAFSPLYINVGFLGMRYQIEKKNPKIKDKKINFNTDISPLSIQYIGVFNKNVDPTRFGIEQGKNHLTNFGSTVNARLLVNFNKSVSFNSRFSYFTNYKTVTAELENTLNLPINRYFATSIYLYFRYDDNKQLKPDPTWGHFQIDELLSFGFNYNW